MPWISSQFPFSRDELERALAQSYSADEARQTADHIASLGQETSIPPSPVPREEGTLARDQASLIIPASYFALLAVSSAELAARCEAFREDVRQQGRRSRERVAMARHGIAATERVPEAIARFLDAEDVEADREWLDLCKKARAVAAGRV